MLAKDVYIYIAAAHKVKTVKVFLMVQSIRFLLDTEERWLVSGIAASSVGAEADSLGFSNVDRTL